MTIIRNQPLLSAVWALLLLASSGSARAVFDVYPTPQTNPLNVAASATSAAVPFTEQVGTGTGPGGLDGMYLRLVMLGPACATSTAPDPTVALQADTGTPVTLNSFFQGIRNAPGSGGSEVANARITAEANDVFLIDFAVFVPGSSWQIFITNNDSDARDFTWVVADTNAEASQPWIDVPATLDLDAALGGITVTGQTSDPATVQVANLGTGDLTISGTTLDSGDADFTFTTPGTISPNSCGNLQIAFTGPASPGQSNGTYTIGSNDTTAVSGDPTAAHNEQIALSATAGQLEVMMLLDTSGSMAFMPDGSATVADPGEARWGRLKAATKQFLDLLGTLGSDQGRFGIGMFPDITNITSVCPVPVPSAADFVTARDVTLTETDSAKIALDDHTPVQNCAATPMGFGIGRMMGTTATGFGFFSSDPDAVSFNERFLVLMSDGANNSGIHPNTFYGTGSTSFQGKAVKALTIAYGDPAVTSFEVDHALLTDIATQSLGTPFDAGADDAGLSLKKDFRSAITAALALDPTTDPGGVLQPGSELRRSITVTPYDSHVAFVVNWATISDNWLGVALQTPNCELITPQSAQSDPSILFRGEPTYNLFVFDDDYLHNAADPANPRYGEWTLIIGGPPIASPTAGERAAEPYDYEVITKSRLRLRLGTERSTHYAGDPIELSARVSLDGLGIRGAAANVEVTAPGRAGTNWLAANAVTAKELAGAAAATDTVDATSLGIKGKALQLKGLTFEPLLNVNKLAMSDQSGQGLYRTTIGATSVPGTYELYVTVTGQTEDGISFRREKRLDVRVGVRPDPKFTLIDLQQRQIIKEGEKFFIADVRFWPRDRFGNVLLTDPAIDPRIDLRVENGELLGALDDGLVDGSYSRSFRYMPGAKPAITIAAAGEPLIPELKVQPVEQLSFADRVLAFDLGGEAEKGANQHRAPEAALGDVSQRERDQFVSLGAFGSLAVGVDGRKIVATGGDDLTVFVHIDSPLRPYVVEAQGRGDWIELGRSEGVTQSFSLSQAGLKSTPAIRVRDLSGRTRDATLGPSATPGVSIRGVGFQATKRGGFWLVIIIIAILLAILAWWFFRRAKGGAGSP
jgi:hypothetical protein